MSTEELWFWKTEPSSPPLDTDSVTEWSVHGGDVVEETVETEEPAVVPSRASLAQQLLDDIEEYVKKEESFSDWFEEKVQLPNFDDIQTVLPVVEPLSLPMPAVPAPVQYKAEESLAYVLGHGHLTPPQSPPAVPEQPVYIIQDQPSYVTLLPTQPNFIPEPYVLPSGDLEREMAVVDEVVRGVAQQWEAWESTDTSSRSSEGTEDSDDPEWMPEAVPAVKVTGRRPRQGQPYTIEDRRQRKKEQNKTAATRYRLKKKTEVSVILEEERGLEEKNAALEVKLSDVTREINYLKGLMRELMKVKKPVCK